MGSCLAMLPQSHQLCVLGCRAAGGMEEYQAVKALVAALPPSRWNSSEVRLLNRPDAPALLLLWKRL